MLFIVMINEQLYSFNDQFYFISNYFIIFYFLALKIFLKLHFVQTESYASKFLVRLFRFD